jgi:hypothetical protein
MTIATTSKAAISESARSRVFDLDEAPVSSGGIYNFPYVGGFNSPASQPRISDCIGSCDTLTS